MTPAASGLRRTVARNIFCNNVAVGGRRSGTAVRGQLCDVITAARADVCDGHTGFDADQARELARFARCVALFFILPNRANDISNGTIRVPKRNSRRARIGHELLRRARYGEYSGKEGSNCYSHHVASVTLGANVPFHSALRTWSDAEYFSECRDQPPPYELSTRKYHCLWNHSPRR